MLIACIQPPFAATKRTETGAKSDVNTNCLISGSIGDNLFTGNGNVCDIGRL